ncbi:hypothetical protein SAMN04487843_108198 [Methylobacterium sp. ap11]|uniref:hypothetical protein n=1 Tax=Methylobacterium sp. ap11 TaxID=1761799 RepID=UPI0008AEEBB9|nr:hypothetical protein [Methylobacterium sp. ap11]SEP21268.1 hypothetical protein SAMN04487843_108198 [Methylobacterium sp. ap11]
MTRTHLAARLALLLAAVSAAPAVALDMRFSPIPGNTPGVGQGQAPIKDDTLAINRADGRLFWRKLDGTLGTSTLMNATSSGRRAVEQGRGDDLEVAPSSAPGDARSVALWTDLSRQVEQGISQAATAGYWSDDATPGRFNRIAGRLLIGDAVKYTGQQYTGNSPIGGYASYLERDSVASVISPKGLIGVFGGSRASDQPGDMPGPRAPIGIAGLGISDKPGLLTGVWAGYLETLRQKGSSTTYGLEVAAKNRGTDSITGDPYNPQGTNAVIGTWMAAGADATYGGAPTAPSNIAHLVGRNASTWDKGIVFAADGLSGNDGLTAGQTSIAIEMGMGHMLNWRNAGNTQRNAIWSEVDQPGFFGLKFKGKSAEFFGNGAVPVMRVLGSAAPVNFPVLSSSDTGGTPALQFTGSDANVSGRYVAQGTGSHIFATAGTAVAGGGLTGGATQLQVLSVSGATDWLTIAGSNAGNAFLGLGGSSTNGAIVLTGKGSDGVVLRDGTQTIRVWATTAGVGFNGASPVGKCSLDPLPTDNGATSASISTAVNRIRSCLINNGLAQ